MPDRRRRDHESYDRTYRLPFRKRRPPGGIAAIAAAVFGLAVTLVACSADKPKTETETPPPPVEVTASPTVADFDEAELPLDSYMPTSDQRADLEYATGLLASECMQGFGIDWQPRRPSFDLTTDRNYGPGLVDADHAATYGYHPTPEEREARDIESGLTPEQEAILWGVEPGEPPNPDIPEGGCYGEARRTLGYDPDSHLWLQQLAVEAMTRTLDHPDVRSAYARWSECMQAAGYSYADPWEASNDQTWWQDETAGPSQEEINTAVADVNCKTETNFVGELTAVLAANQQQVVEDNFEQLEATRAEIHEALGNAAETLANPPA